MEINIETREKKKMFIKIVVAEINITPTTLLWHVMHFNGPEILARYQLAN